MDAYVCANSCPISDGGRPPSKSQVTQTKERLIQNAMFLKWAVKYLFSEAKGKAFYNERTLLLSIIKFKLWLFQPSNTVFHVVPWKNVLPTPGCALFAVALSKVLILVLS